MLKKLANKDVRPTRFRSEVLMQVLIAIALEAFLGGEQHGVNPNYIGDKSVGFSARNEFGFSHKSTP